MKTVSLRGMLDKFEPLAEGGMSQIYKARQPLLNRNVVIKKLKEELLDNPEAIDSFQNEAEILAQTSHPCLPRLYDFVSSERESYLILEHVDGIDLRDAIKSTGNLTVEASVAVALGLAEAVHELHAKGWLHLDIKPTNIRLTHEGGVKLLDLGIARKIGDTTQSSHPGSPSYVSPEQLEGAELTPATDVFLVGQVLYESLTGLRPFQEDEEASAHENLLAGKHVPLHKLEPKVPANLAELVAKCLSFNPRERFSSAAEMLVELETIFSEVSLKTPQTELLSFIFQNSLVEVSEKTTAAAKQLIMARARQRALKKSNGLQRSLQAAVAVVIGIIIAAM